MIESFWHTIWLLNNKYCGQRESILKSITVGPQTERPQAERTSQLNDFQLGPKWFEMNDFLS